MRRVRRRDEVDRGERTPWTCCAAEGDHIREVEHRTVIDSSPENRQAERDVNLVTEARRLEHWQTLNVCLREARVPAVRRTRPNATG